MACYEFEGVRPVVHPDAYVHPQAVLIGDVIVGAGAFIGPHAALRGDYGRLVVEEGANVQDNCTMHGYSDVVTIVGAGSSVGHGAVLHGCHIGAGALIGMNSVVMDGARIGPQCLVAAMSFVTAGFVCEAGQLLRGIPAKVIRSLRSEELGWNALNSKEYQDLAQRYRARLVPCMPLAALEAHRPQLQGTTEVLPLHEMKQADGLS